MDITGSKFLSGRPLWFITHTPQPSGPTDTGDSSSVASEVEWNLSWWVQFLQAPPLSLGQAEHCGWAACADLS